MFLSLRHGSANFAMYRRYWIMSYSIWLRDYCWRWPTMIPQRQSIISN